MTFWIRRKTGAGKIAAYAVEGLGPCAAIINLLIGLVLTLAPE